MPTAELRVDRKRVVVGQRPSRPSAPIIGLLLAATENHSVLNRVIDFAQLDVLLTNHDGIGRAVDHVSKVYRRGHMIAVYEREGTIGWSRTRVARACGVIGRHPSHRAASCDWAQRNRTATTRAKERGDLSLPRSYHRCVGCRVVIESVRLIDACNGCLVGVIQIALFDEGKKLHGPGMPILSAARAQIGKFLVGIVVHVHGQSKLLQVVLALHSAGRFSGCLNRRQ